MCDYGCILGLIEIINKAVRRSGDTFCESIGEERKVTREITMSWCVFMAAFEAGRSELVGGFGDGESSLMFD
jgi:hypothetical protein